MTVALRPDKEMSIYLSSKAELIGGDGMIYRDEFLRAAKNAEEGEDIPAAEQLRARADELGDDPEAYFETKELKDLRRAAANLKAGIVLIFAPIVSTFLIGAGLLWAMRGFRKDKV